MSILTDSMVFFGTLPLCSDCYVEHICTSNLCCFRCIITPYLILLLDFLVLLQVLVLIAALPQLHVVGRARGGNQVLVIVPDHKQS